MTTNSSTPETRLAAEKITESRSVPVPRTLARVTKDEPRAANADQHGFAAKIIHFPPQAADMDVDEIGLRNETVVPYMLQQHVPGHDLVGPAHEILQQAEFAAGERDDLAIALGLMLDQIEFQRTHAQHRRAG